jgi:hypothetical protein
MLLAHHFDPHSTTYHPTNPSSDPFPCSVSPTGSALGRTWLRAFLAVSPACLGRIVFTCVADWVSCTRLLQTTPHGIALTLCFLFFHGLTMQDFHLR